MGFNSAFKGLICVTACNQFTGTAWCQKAEFQQVHLFFTDEYKYTNLTILTCIADCVLQIPVAGCYQ